MLESLSDGGLATSFGVLDCALEALADFFCSDDGVCGREAAICFWAEGGKAIRPGTCDCVGAPNKVSRLMLSPGALAALVSGTGCGACVCGGL